MAKRSSDGWLSVIEATRVLGISREAIYRAIKEGRLKARQRTVTRRIWQIARESLSGFKVSEHHKKMGEARAATRGRPRRRVDSR